MSSRCERSMATTKRSGACIALESIIAPMDKFTVAKTLDEISRYVELSDPNPFRARAFEKAARAVEKLEDSIDSVVASGEILKVSGIGKATAQIIEEIVRTGSSRYL